MAMTAKTGRSWTQQSDLVIIDPKLQSWPVRPGKPH